MCGTIAAACTLARFRARLAVGKARAVFTVAARGAVAWFGDLSLSPCMIRHIATVATGTRGTAPLSGSIADAVQQEARRLLAVALLPR